MIYRVLIFGPLAQSMGTRDLAADVPEPATVAGVNEALARAHPDDAAFFRTARLAVNSAFAPKTQPLNANDEVAIIEMVSGG